MRPDIAILSPLARNAGPTHGGISPVIIALSAGLCDAGAGVELLTLSDDDPRQRWPQLHPDLSLYPLGRGRRWQQARRLRDYLAQRAPRALLAAGHRANLLAARQAGGDCRILLSVHNALTPGLRRLNPLRRWGRRQALRRWYPRADAIICVSQGVAEDVAHLVPRARDRIHTRYNPISSAETEPKAPLHPWLIDPATPVILGVGRLTTQKGFATLIRAFAQLGQQASQQASQQAGQQLEQQTRQTSGQSSLQPPRLLILGEGPERAALQALAVQLGVAERVALPGFVPNPKAQMAAASVFVLSSVWEGFGNVLVEAMGVGTPVVATDCPSGPREILVAGRYGPLVPIEDVQALAAAIERQLAAPTSALQLQARAADFAPERVAASYLELLLPDWSPPTETDGHR
ncbi:MAG: glycosyl transferase [Halochromatium sp.]|nr:glycosyl transferase [Halochromatium sp.]